MLGGGGVSKKMTLYDTWWGGQPKMTDDNDGSLSGRGCAYLEKNECKTHVFADKYFKTVILYASGGPKVTLKRVQMEPFVQT